jgi:hypothetical protein
MRFQLDDEVAYDTRGHGGCWGYARATASQYSAPCTAQDLTPNDVRAAGARQSGKAEQWMTQQRSAFDAYRTSFTAAQLAAPGTISNSMTRDNVIRVDDPAGKPLAKVDPAYAQRDPQHIHVIVVGLSPQPKTDPNSAWFKASLEALDYTALGKLLSE